MKQRFLGQSWQNALGAWGLFLILTGSGGMPLTIAQAIAETTSESTSQTTAEPTSQTTAETTSQTTSETTSQTTAETTSQTTSEPTSQATEPATEPTTEQATEPTTEPVTEATNELNIEPVTEQATEPTTEPIIEPAIDERTTETVIEPTIDEPVTDQTPERSPEPAPYPADLTNPMADPMVESEVNPTQPMTVIPARLPGQGFEANRNVFLFQDLQLSPGFNPDPQWLRGVAGGEETAIAISDREQTPTGACVGFINTLPNHRLTLDQIFYSLRVRVKSEGDTTIVIRGPGGVWCNDDYDGSNAGIAGQWLAGNYEIWVGAYTENTFLPYQLEVSEVVLPRADRDRDFLFRSP